MNENTPIKQVERRFNRDGTPKRDAITIMTKKEIIDDVEAGMKYDKIKEKYGLKYTSNVSRIIKEKSKWLAEFEKESSPFRKTTKTTKYENIDKGIRNFVINCNKTGTPIGNQILKEKVLQLVQATGQTELTVSNGFICRALKRTNITMKKQYGESNSVCTDLIIQWQYKLSDYLKNAEPQDIWNGDELGLFWRMLPNKSYVIKDGVCKFGKQSKERITVFVCGNMMGEKYKLTVIGKSEKPRNFNLISKLPLHYMNNSKAWMTTDLFYEFITKFNKFNLDNKRFAILFVDNCSAHPENLNFSNVKIHFLPPNTTLSY